MATRRANLTDEEKRAVAVKRKEYNATYYLKNRSHILDKAWKKRAQTFIQKHGEDEYWNNYRIRNVPLRKLLGGGLLDKDGKPAPKVEEDPKPDVDFLP
ncbi:hypothetical protein V5O48_012886 [Marasmius crinis-equi]|uniref:Uncharacterized protein n=1 Tax=Marasmius crinis-equi TaxID=585013 RepID=A0ABR3F1J7_9AGAR